MLLDFIATNNWERAVYFTSISDIKNVLGIDKYLHQEGLVHRFIPVEADYYYKNSGGVYVEGSYDLLMNKVNWGNINDPDVSLDPETRRNILYAKQAYLRLAQALQEQGKNDSAVKVMDKCLEFFPDDKMPFDFYMMYYPDLYYSAGATEKGDALVRTIANNALDNINYYERQAPHFQTYYTESIRENLALINQMLEVTQKNKRSELSKELQSILDEKINLLYNLL